MKISRAASRSSSISRVKVSRSLFFLISSASPGSWIGTSPALSASTFSGTISRTTTLWPSSAKQAAVTRPTQPAPTTPIGSRSSAQLLAPRDSRRSVIPLAMPIISSSDSDWTRVLETQ